MSNVAYAAGCAAALKSFGLVKIALSDDTVVEDQQENKQDANNPAEAIELMLKQLKVPKQQTIMPDNLTKPERKNGRNNSTFNGSSSAATNFNQFDQSNSNILGL